MTIRFLRQWNGYDDQDKVTLSSEEETRLVGLGLATFDIVEIGSSVIKSDELTLLRQSILINPNLAPKIGEAFMLSDGIMQNRIVTWQGDGFRPLNNVVVKNSVDLINSTLGTANYEHLALTVPGFLMGLNSSLKIFSTWSYPNISTNNKTLLHKFGGIDLGGGGAVANSNFVNEKRMYEIFNVNSLANQYSLVGLWDYNVTNSAPKVMTVDTSADFEISFGSFWASTPAGGSEIALKAYEIQVVG